MCAYVCSRARTYTRDALMCMCTRFCLFLSVSVCLYLYLHLCLCLCLRFLYPSIFLSVSASIWLSISLHCLCPSLCAFVCGCLSHRGIDGKDQGKCQHAHSRNRHHMWHIIDLLGKCRVLCAYAHACTICICVFVHACMYLSMYDVRAHVCKHEVANLQHVRHCKHACTRLCVCFHACMHAFMQACMCMYVLAPARL
jgi:hypothetical protein